MADQTPKPERTRPRPYGTGRGRGQGGHYVMTSLWTDAHMAVQAVMAEHNLSASGAVHHLVRLGAGLPTLLP
jgi:hypothetical protein